MPTGRHVCKLSGFAPSLPTPFDDDDRIDSGAFERLCARQVAEGATALVVGSAIGEDWALTTEELRELIHAAVAAARGIPVIAGASSNSTKDAIERALIVERAGADAILSSVPYYNKPSQAGIVAHFQAISDSTSLPLFVADDPLRTASTLADDTIKRVAEIPQVAGLMDATGNLPRLERVRVVTGDKFRLLAGQDSQALAFLISGGDGCISAVSNIAPALCRNMYLAYKQGNIGQSRRLALALSDLTSALMCESSSASVKYALKSLGIMGARMRPPLTEPNVESKMKIENAIRTLYGHGMHVGTLSIDLTHPKQ